MTPRVLLLVFALLGLPSSNFIGVVRKSSAVVVAQGEGSWNRCWPSSIPRRSLKSAGMPLSAFGVARPSVVG